MSSSSESILVSEVSVKEETLVVCHVAVILRVGFSLSDVNPPALLHVQLRMGLLSGDPGSYERYTMGYP